MMHFNKNSWWYVATEGDRDFAVIYLVLNSFSQNRLRNAYLVLNKDEFPVMK